MSHEMIQRAFHASDKRIRRLDDDLSFAARMMADAIRANRRHWIKRITALAEARNREQNRFFRLDKVLERSWARKQAAAVTP